MRISDWSSDVCSSDLTMVGEATTGYLRSHVAISEILKYAAEARFIVGLRNPVQMAISWHGQTTFEGWENEPDYAKKWRLQEIRLVGDNIQPGCPDIGDVLKDDVGARSDERRVGTECVGQIGYGWR